MPVEWKGEELKEKMTRASALAIDATMSAAIILARASHGAGAHSSRRFVSHSGELERGTRITQYARPFAGGVRGVWGVRDVIYARRIELGFQGKDAAGRVFNAPPYPYLRPAAEAEYPKLAKRLARAVKRA